MSTLSLLGEHGVTLSLAGSPSTYQESREEDKNYYP